MAGTVWPTLAVPSVVPHVENNCFLVGLRPRARPGARKGDGLLAGLILRQFGASWARAESNEKSVCLDLMSIFHYRFSKAN